MSNKDIDDLLNKKVKVLFGLEAQGHIPLIEEKLKTWWPRFSDSNPFQVWEDIAKEIGWIDHAVCDSYIRHLRIKDKNSTPNAKIQDLIKEYGYDKDNTHGFITDLNKLIGAEDA